MPVLFCSPSEALYAELYALYRSRQALENMLRHLFNILHYRLNKCSHPCCVFHVTASSHGDDGIEVQPTTVVSPTNTTNPVTDVADVDPRRRWSSVSCWRQWTSTKFQSQVNEPYLMNWWTTPLLCLLHRALYSCICFDWSNTFLAA